MRNTDESEMRGEEEKEDDIEEGELREGHGSGAVHHRSVAALSDNAGSLQSVHVASLAARHSLRLMCLNLRISSTDPTSFSAVSSSYTAGHDARRIYLQVQIGGAAIVQPFPSSSKNLSPPYLDTSSASL
ncbi:hypothetical protein PIB30_037262 [Stylosanthes scabra]|uniref:Uncharacterized protein n=1 Tax=Stylosanthes scabra TaxID=79078 RepID=A0ABU6TDV8_9FABA|nr:hypothetical protein [Stylosanthes scabra]